MTDDRSLLEAAARAAGIPFAFHPGTAQPVTFTGSAAFPTFVPWNPLHDDGDALRLAVKLHLALLFPMKGDTYPLVGAGQVGSMTAAETEPASPDPYAATRRCIVRAAAAIGRAS